MIRSLNLCQAGARTYAILWRILHCTYCGAAAGDPCVGAKGGPIVQSHLARKLALSAWRRDCPALYKIVRDAVADSLVNERPLKLPEYLVLVEIREAVERAARPLPHAGKDGRSLDAVESNQSERSR